MQDHSCKLNVKSFRKLNIIRDYVNNDNQFTRKTAIPQDKFLDLVNLVLTTTRCTFNSQFYQQTDRVAMGGPEFNRSWNLYTYPWTHCNVYGTTPSKSLGTICLWRLNLVTKPFCWSKDETTLTITLLFTKTLEKNVFHLLWTKITEVLFSVIKKLLCNNSDSHF